MEFNFLLLYLCLLALFYILPFFWNTRYSYVVFLSVFHVHHIPFVHLSPYSFLPDLIFQQCSQFSNFFTLIHYEFGCCIFFSLIQHFPLILPAPFQFPCLSHSSFYLTLHYFILFRIIFNFIKDANQLSKVYSCFSFVLAFYIFSAVLWFCIT